MILEKLILLLMLPKNETPFLTDIPNDHQSNIQVHLIIHFRHRVLHGGLKNITKTSVISLRKERMHFIYSIKTIAYKNLFQRMSRRCTLIATHDHFVIRKVTLNLTSTKDVTRCLARKWIWECLETRGGVNRLSI